MTIDELLAEDEAKMDATADRATREALAAYDSVLSRAELPMPTEVTSLSDLLDAPWRPLTMADYAAAHRAATEVLREHRERAAEFARDPYAE